MAASRPAVPLPPGPRPAEPDLDAVTQVWIPLVDGTERLGVLSLTVADASEAMLASYRALASLVGLMIGSKAAYSDSYAALSQPRPARKSWNPVTGCCSAPTA